MTGLDFNATMGQAVAHHKAGRFGDAVVLYRRASDAFPDQPDPVHLLGLALHKLGDEAGALRAVERAVALLPQHPGYRFSQGNLLLGQRRFAEAETAFRAALEAAPQEAEFVNHLAVALLEQRKLDEAERALRELVTRLPGFLPAKNNLAALLVRTGRHAEAEQLAREVLALEPHNVEAANNLGGALVEMERWDDAEPVLRAALKLAPQHAQLNYNMGLVFKGRREWVKAETLLRTAVKLNPGHAPNLLALSYVLRELNLLEDGLALAKRAVELDPHDPETQLGLALALRENGFHLEAVGVAQRSMELGGESARRHAALGSLYWELGKLDDAKRVLERALELVPGWLTVYALLANCERYKSLDDPNVKAMLDGWARRETLDQESHMQLGFALGKVHDDVGEYDRAFAFYAEGNRLKRTMVPAFERDFGETLPAVVRETFTPEMLARQQAAGLSTEEPVFVVGMPRSGTSLCEQIISSHPDAFGAGELIKLREITARAEVMALSRGGPEYPRALAHLLPHEIRELAEIYLRHIRDAAGEPKLRIVDKMPANFRNIGLMAIMFPRARIVHCRRDPMDNCLSIYFQNFGKGNGFAYDQVDLGNFYNDYRELMRAWHEIEPLRILDLQYEEVVADPERKARELIEFIGLPWDDRCLKFHEKERAVRTASAWQVRQPIYKRSVARWRRYEKHLQPLADTLGYDVNEDAER